MHADAHLLVENQNCHHITYLVIIALLDWFIPGPRENKTTMKLNTAVAILVGTSCARIPQPAVAFIVGHDHRHRHRSR